MASSRWTPVVGSDDGLVEWVIACVFCGLIGFETVVIEMVVGMMRIGWHAALGATLLWGTIGCRSETPRQVNEETESARMAEPAETCEILDAHMARFGLAATLEVRDDSCLIDGSASLDTLEMEADPLNVLRDSMIEAGWTEALEFTADGPGTSSYRVVRDGEYCQVYGGAPAWIDDEDEIRHSDEYFLKVACHRQL